MKLILMRGVSASGKSTLARKLALQNPESVICSTDDFFVVDGKYQFNSAQLNRNHYKNFLKVKENMAKKTPVIIVDNTNLQKWEMLKYVIEAKTFGYEIEIQEPESVSLDEICRRQEKRAEEGKVIAREVIERQLEKYEPTTVEELLSLVDQGY